MKARIKLLRANARKLPLVALLLAVPWIWAIPFVPVWVSIASLLLLVPACVALVIFVLPAPPAPRRATDASQISNREIIAMRARDAAKISSMHTAMSGMRDHVDRWSDTSEVSNADLKLVQDEMGEVMRQTEAAVISIGESFRAITAKTATQMDCAMRLLRSGGDQAGGGALASWLSLPDYIRAYDFQLATLIERMLHFSHASAVINDHQTAMRGNTNLVDELLDQLRQMAKRSGRLALESSVLASGTGTGTHQREIVDLTDSIRAISEETHDLTRSIRISLESIKEQVALTYKVMRSSSDSAARAAEQARVDVAQLNLTMIEKTREVERTFEQINSLGKEIQGDISKIIVAMQFQDITQQRLERLKQPVLNRVILGLRTVSDESSQVRDQVASVLGVTETQSPFMVVRGGQANSVPAGAAPTEGARPAGKPAAEPVRAPAGDAGVGDNVDLF